MDPTFSVTCCQAQGAAHTRGCHTGRSDQPEEWAELGGRGAGLRLPPAPPSSPASWTEPPGLLGRTCPLALGTQGQTMRMCDAGD